MMMNFRPLLFKFHIYLLNSVWFLSDSSSKDCLWFASLVLNAVSVSPTYVSVSPWSGVTVAWCTIPLDKHWFCSGHDSFFLQLHSLSSCAGFSLILFLL